MLVVELLKKKSLVLITAIIFVGIAYAHEYDEHQTIRRLARKKEVLRRTMYRMYNDKEDVEFWTRLMKVGSMPDGGGGPTTGLSPPPFTPAPSDSIFVPATTPPVGETEPPVTVETDPPVVEATDPPVTMETDPPVTMATNPPIGSAPKFNCPEPDFVGCTAPDPSNPEDECPTVGESCDTGNGEYCCLDACPRNFCTAKEGRVAGE